MDRLRQQQQQQQQQQQKQKNAKLSTMTAAAAAAAAASAAAADSANGLAWIRPKSNLQVMLCPSVTVSRILAVATPVAHLLSIAH